MIKFSAFSLSLSLFSSLNCQYLSNKRDSRTILVVVVVRNRCKNDVKTKQKSQWFEFRLKETKKNDR